MHCAWHSRCEKAAVNFLSLVLNWVNSHTLAIGIGCWWTLSNSCYQWKCVWKAVWANISYQTKHFIPDQTVLARIRTNYNTRVQKVQAVDVICSRCVILYTCQGRKYSMSQRRQLPPHYLALLKIKVGLVSNRYTNKERSLSLEEVHWVRDRSGRLRISLTSETNIDQ